MKRFPILSIFKKNSSHITPQFTRYQYRIAFDEILYRRCLSGVIHAQQPLSVDFSISTNDLRKKYGYPQLVFNNKLASVHHASYYPMELFNLPVDVEYHFLNDHLFYVRCDFRQSSSEQAYAVRKELLDTFAGRVPSVQSLRIIDANGSEMIIHMGENLLIEYMHTRIAHQTELICNQLHRPALKTLSTTISFSMQPV